MFTSLNALLSLAGTLVAAQTGTAQIDMLFPRPNETYKRVYPFPVVFALHNPAALWPYGFKYTWQLMALDRSTSPGWGTFPNATAGVETSGTFEGPDPLINIFATDVVVNTMTKACFIHWHLFTVHNCTPAAEGAEDTTPTFAEEIPRTTGVFDVYFDDDNGKLPDIYIPNVSDDGDSNCPTPLWTVNIKSEERTTVFPIQTSTDSCPFLDPEDPEDPHPEPQIV